MRILVAEDNILERRLLAASLTKWGYDVVEAGDGNQAWELLQSEDAPRLVLLDWMMPGMDGTDICQKIRQEEKLNPMYIILLTSKEQKQDVIFGLKSGIDDYIRKPYEQKELRARVKAGELFVRLQSELAEIAEERRKTAAHIEMLQELLPVCSNCHERCDNPEVWRRIKRYVADHPEAGSGPGLCLKCTEKCSSERRQEMPSEKRSATQSKDSVI